uniref:Uncharacterized protein n=1 Tax=Octopus bimaculoides TaxID=37653 RepID=A0A0L8HVE8_OCTBM
MKTVENTFNTGINTDSVNTLNGDIIGLREAGTSCLHIKRNTRILGEYENSFNTGDVGSCVLVA